MYEHVVYISVHIHMLFWSYNCKALTININGSYSKAITAQCRNKSSFWYCFLSVCSRDILSHCLYASMDQSEDTNNTNGLLFFCNKYYYVTLGNKCLVSITKKLCITFLVKSSFSRWLHFVFCQASQLGGRHH